METVYVVQQGWDSIGAVDYDIKAIFRSHQAAIDFVRDKLVGSGWNEVERNYLWTKNMDLWLISKHKLQNK